MGIRSLYIFYFFIVEIVFRRHGRQILMSKIDTRAERVNTAYKIFIKKIMTFKRSIKPLFHVQSLVV